MSDDVRVLKNLAYVAGYDRERAAVERIAARLEATEAALRAVEAECVAKNCKAPAHVIVRAALAALDKETPKGCDCKGEFHVCSPPFDHPKVRP